MLHWSLAFFVLAVIAAMLGFGWIAAGAAEIGKILFVFFVVAFLASFLLRLTSRNSPR